MSDTNRIAPQEAEVLELASSELTYLPTPDQRRAKSAFWARFEQNPLCEPSEISLAIAARLSGDNRVFKWWRDPGFQSWFRNRDEWRQRLENAAHLALDRLESIVIDPRANASAAVAASKLLLEAARKMPSRKEIEEFLDEKIGKMDQSELQKFIAERMKYLTGSQNSDTVSSQQPSIDKSPIPEE